MTHAYKRKLYTESGMCHLDLVQGSLNFVLAIPIQPTNFYTMLLIWVYKIGIHRKHLQTNHQEFYKRVISHLCDLMIYLNENKYIH